MITGRSEYRRLARAENLSVALILVGTAIRSIESAAPDQGVAPPIAEEEVVARSPEEKVGVPTPFDPIGTG